MEFSLDLEELYTKNIDHKDIEAEIEKLWEKIKKTSEIIFLLKEENNVLRSDYQKITKLYDEIKIQMAIKDQEITRLRTEFAKLSSSSVNSFTPQEKEVLKKKITDLIAKINSHL